MSGPVILAIDQGTTGTRAFLVSRGLDVVSSAYRELPQHFPRPGRVEHDPDEIWGTVVATVAEALERSGLERSAIAGIGITNQRETALIWRRDDGEAIHRAIVWQDRRTSGVCEDLTARGEGERIGAVTGLLADPYFSGTKLAWILDNVKGARRMARDGKLAAGTIDSYLLWRLTGGAIHATDITNASRTMLWPLEGDDWSAEMCEIISVPAGVLPRVASCSEVLGETRGFPGLPDGIPVCGMIGDQQSALFAQGCFEPSSAKCTYGTGAFAMLNVGDRPAARPAGLLSTIGWRTGGETTYCLEGSAFMAGALVQWLRDGLGLFEKAAEVEDLARQVEDSGGVVVVPAHAGLGAPHWKPRARGLVCGLTRGTTSAHLARASLEGIAHQVADLLEAMASATGRPLEILKVDGGAAANDLLMQIQADLLGVGIERPKNLESTAMGAVFMAGLGCGLFGDLEDLGAARKIERRFEPAGDPERISQMRVAWADAVEKA